MATNKYASLNTLREFLENLKTIFASITHKHTMSDLTDYTVDAELSTTSTNPVQNKVVAESINTLADGVAYIDISSNETIMTEAAMVQKMEEIEYASY